MLQGEKNYCGELVKEFEPIASNFDENAIKEEQPEELVKKLAISKAREVFERVQQNYRELTVIGGDTVVYFNGKILGKPKNEEDACNMLKELQNNVNYVYSGLAVITKKDGRVIEKNDYTKTAVYIKKMTEKEIKEYVKTGEPLDKAGSYAIQGIGGKFIDKIEGSYNNVVGMDTEKLSKYLGED
ncbi:MAG: Maf family protein [Clostridia bacterium]|nr:Maf family protein [Clostridia bacterium]